MVALSSPKTIYFSRIGQLAFAIGFLIILSYCGVHRAWWNNINGAIAVGGPFPLPLLIVLSSKIHFHHYNHLHKTTSLTNKALTNTLTSSHRRRLHHSHNPPNADKFPPETQSLQRWLHSSDCHPTRTRSPDRSPMGSYSRTHASPQERLR